MHCFSTPCISMLQNPWSPHFVLLQGWTSNLVEMFSFLIKHRMTWTGYFHSWDLIAGDLWCTSYVPSLVASSDLFSFHDTCKCLLSKTLILRSYCGVVRTRTHGRSQETQLRNCFLFWPSPDMMFFFFHDNIIQTWVFENLENLGFLCFRYCLCDPLWKALLHCLQLNH